MLKRIYILLLFFFILCFEITAQTCCSGGVPLTGNLGMPSASAGTWQVSPSYDLNYMNTTKIGSRVTGDAARQRFTQSLLLETGYAISDQLSVSAMFSYIFQSRIINGPAGRNKDAIHGIGDAVILLTYRAIGGYDQRWELLIGGGPKLPLGRSDKTRPDGIEYSADLQPGSGSLDAIVWGLLSRQGIIRPSANLSLRMIYRHTGANDDYLGFTRYRFGNELQVITGISDQIIIGNEVFNPSLLVRYRSTRPDFLGGAELPNTGGHWFFLVPGLVYQTSPDFHARLAAEIPVYSYLTGVQLTTNFRITAGLYFRINGRKKSSLIL